MQPMTSLRVDTAQNAGELERHRDAWNALAARSPQQLPMSSYAWTATYFEKFLAPEVPWACFFAYRGTTLAAVLPIVVRVARRAGLALRFLQTPRDDHTQIGDLLLDAPDDVAAVNAIVAAARDRFPAAGCLEINRFPGNSALLGVLAKPGLAFAHTVHADSFGAYLPVPADFAAYRGALSKNFKSNLNKAANKVAKLADVGYRFDAGREPYEHDFNEFLAVEASGWKGARGSAIAKSPLLTAFYATLVERLREAGWLEWQIMTGDGLTLAANLSIRMPRSIVVWKLGYNDDYSRCSPGSILLEEIVKRESAGGVIEEINLTTDLPWYDNWEMRKRTYYTARFYFGWRGRLFWHLPDALRDRARRMPALVALKRRLRKSARASEPDSGASK
jgi:CelD/BcsL family acetyltransferase involved in cellulose biosynthesis